MEAKALLVPLSWSMRVGVYVLRVPVFHHAGTHPPPTDLGLDLVAAAMERR